VLAILPVEQRGIAAKENVPTKTPKEKVYPLSDQFIFRRRKYKLQSIRSLFKNTGGNSDLNK
jgi:hypothetical protein